MKEINPFPFGLARLTHAEHYQYHYSNSLLEPLVEEIPPLGAPWGGYKTSFEKEDVIYKRDPKSEETDEIAVRNQLRDDAFRLFGQTANTQTKNLNPLIAAAAKRIARVHHNYRMAPNMPLLANSAQITNFYKDLQTPEHQADLVLLNLKELSEDIHTHNDILISLHEQRGLHSTALKEEGNMAAARVATDKAHNFFVSAVNSLYNVNELTTRDPVLRQKLANIIDRVNTHTEEIRVEFARRTGHKGKGKTKPDADAPENPDAGGDETPDTPNVPETPDGPSHFAMVNQSFYGNHPGFSGCATHMSAEAVDPAAFAAALIPAAEGATLRMYTGYEDYFTDFPIESLMVTVDGGSPVPGLVITPQSSNFAFGSTIPDRPELGVEVIKDGEILATIGGVIRPIYVGEG